MSGNPANLQIRYGFEQTAGHGDVTNWTDMRARSEAVGGDFPTIEDDSIIAYAEEQEGLPTKITPGGAINLNYHSEDHAKILAAFFGHSATPVESPTGAYTHKLSPRETDVDFGYLAFEVSRDLSRPTLYMGALPSQLTFNTAARSLLNGAATLLLPRFKFWKDATQSVGTGSTLPELRNWSKYSALTAADGDIYITVTTGPAGGTFGITCKIGSAGTDGSEITVTPGQWIALTEGASDDPVGSVDLPVEIWFDDVSVSLNDVFVIARERAVWNQSLPETSVMNEIATTVSVDGTSFRTRDLSLTLTRPLELDEAIGGRFVDTILEQGQRTVSGQLNRRAIDNAMVNRLLRAESFELQIECYGSYITGVTPATRRKWTFIMKNCQASGRTPSVGGRTAFDEPIPFKAYPSDDATYPSAITAELLVSQADLAA